MNDVIDDISSNIYQNEIYQDIEDTILSFNFEKGKKRVEKVYSMSNAIRYKRLDAAGITTYIKSLASEAPIDIDLLLPTILAYGKIVLKIPDIENKDRVAHFCLLEPVYRKILRSALPKFVDQYQQSDIIDLPISQTLKDVFMAAEIFNAIDLGKQSVSSLLALAFYDLDNFFNAIIGDQYFPLNADSFIGIATGSKHSSDSPVYSYFRLKCDDVGGHIYTDDEICSILDVPKNRLKKVEQSELNDLKSYDYVSNWKYGLYAFYIIKGNKPFLTFGDAKMLIGNDYLYFLFRMFVWNDNVKWSPIVVDSDLYLIYDSNIVSTDEIIKIYYADLPLSISSDNTFFNSTEKAIVDKKNNPKKYEVKRVPNMSKMVREVLEQDFGEGYRVGSDQDFEMLKKLIKVRYGVSPDQLTPHGVSSLISKDDDFVLCDRGTYRLRFLCPRISDHLAHRIIEYIRTYKSKTVFYAIIYNDFEYELRENGINNTFLLKGLLDPVLPPDMNTKRNYITKTKSNDDTSYNAGQNLISELRKFSDVFSLDDLKSRFPGLKEYVLYNYLYGEEQNHLIFLNNKRFIYLDKLKITESDIAELHEFLESSFVSNGNDILSIKVLYSRLCQLNSDLLEKINSVSYNLFDNDFSFFSLVRQLFSNEYFYDRPFISKIGGIKLTIASVIAYYLKDQNFVSHDDIKRVAQGLGSATTNLNVCEIHDCLSETHVLIDYSRLIKKDLFNLKDDDKERIEEVVDHYISMDKDGAFKTAQINYKLFPTLRYQWNGHLLAGILRSYFSNKYSVKKDDRIMKNDFYTIRRK